MSMDSTQTARTSPSTLFAVGGYMSCSALMLISNKVAVHLLPAPSFILFAQLMGTVIVVYTASILGLIKNLDKLEWKKALAFAPVAMIFLTTIFTNLKSLEYANVETFMVFRFSTPLAISIADYCFLGRNLPSMRSWFSLVGLLIGALGYVMNDSFYHVSGYTFCMIWYGVFCLDQIYLKHITNTVKMESNWGRVLYSNLLGAIPLFFGSIGELDTITNRMDFYGFLALAFSVLLGAAMSYFAWLARSLVSATSFTILGNVCKVLTIAINVLLWDKHASTVGIAWLFLCLGSAYFYKQAPLRNIVEKHENNYKV